MTLFAIKARVDSILDKYASLQISFTEEALSHITNMVEELLDKITPSPTYWDIDDIMDDIEEAIELLQNTVPVPIYVPPHY
jgi:hypothetical protein